jgi:peptidoglycan/xylan/chitin deacetylase (PgdA/CDA1 family)
LTDTSTSYPRDMLGYGAAPPDARWPGGARIALQIVMNYEEGGENCILHGDPASEAFLSESVGAVPWPGQRNMNMESVYEYGSRAGFWRLHRMLTSRAIPVTVFGVATALMRNREAVAAMREAGWEIASHGLKWIDYKDFSRADEQRHLDEAIHIHIREAVIDHGHIAAGARQIGRGHRCPGARSAVNEKRAICRHPILVLGQARIGGVDGFGDMRRLVFRAAAHIDDGGLPFAPFGFGKVDRFDRRRVAGRVEIGLQRIGFDEPHDVVVADANQPSGRLLDFGVAGDEDDRLPAIADQGTHHGAERRLSGA